MERKSIPFGKVFRMNFELFETAVFAFSVFEGLVFGSLYASSVPGKKLFGSDFKKERCALRCLMPAERLLLVPQQTYDIRPIATFKVIFQAFLSLLSPFVRKLH